MSLSNTLVPAFKGLKYAMTLALDQITDIFGHDDTISLENSEIITNDLDRAKISEAIDSMLEAQMENARNNNIQELEENVILENGNSITLRL